MAFFTEGIAVLQTLVTANLIDPWICPKIIDDLAILCEKLNINKLTEIVGKAHVES
ncbi:MAG: hypothetical protein GX326_02535 [Clostridiaceae bacterium]|nr:hypothetical protein [Clostridiaceae bacterium]